MATSNKTNNPSVLNVMLPVGNQTSY